MVSLRTLTQHCGDTAHGSFPAAFYFYTSWAPPKPDEGTKPGRLPTATKPYTTSPKTNPKKIRKKTAKDAAAVTQASISSVYFERLLPYTRTRIVALELAALACHWRALWQVGLCLCVHYYFFFFWLFFLFLVCVDVTTTGVVCATYVRKPFWSARRHFPVLYTRERDPCWGEGVQNGPIVDQVRGPRWLPF